MTYSPCIRDGFEVPEKEVTTRNGREQEKLLGATAPNGARGVRQTNRDSKKHSAIRVKSKA